MRLTLSAAVIVLAALMSYGLYNMKYEVLRLQSELSNLLKRNEADRDTLRVLRAEWAQLNRPERLERLAALYLDLAPISASQISTLSDLPSRSTAAKAEVPTETHIFHLAGEKKRLAVSVGGAQ
jgi:cell division protein FtsL